MHEMWIETAISIAEDAFYKYNTTREAIRYIQECAEICPDVTIIAKVYDAIESARTEAPDVFSRARDQLVKDSKIPPHETLDDLVRRLVFWIVYTKAVDHYKVLVTKKEVKEE